MKKIFMFVLISMFSFSVVHAVSAMDFTGTGLNFQKLCAQKQSITPAFDKQMPAYPDKTIVINSYDKHRKKLVKFSHDLHMNSGADEFICEDCHHTMKRGEPVKKCTECHTSDAKKSMKKVSHTFCKDCHKEFKAGPTNCKGCHI